MNKGYRICSIVLISLLIAPSVYALNETVTGSFGFNAVSGGQPIYGDYINSESYSSIGGQEDYDPGVLEDSWGWHLISDTEVQSLQGIVSSTSQTTVPVAAWEGSGNVSLDLNESVEALAWTNTQSVYSAAVAETVDISFHHNPTFNVPVGLSGSVDYYFGIWENGAASGDFMLAEQDGWSLVDLNYQGLDYTLLKKSFSMASRPSSQIITAWSLNFGAGQDYDYFTYVEAETAIVPEPMTILLLGGGMMMVRRKK